MYARILVPVDGSPTSDAGLVEAVRLARLCGGAVRLLHVVDDTPYVPEAAMYGAPPIDTSQQALERGGALLEALAARVAHEGVPVDTVLVEGAGRSLREFVADQVTGWRAEVVVLGTHGRRGLGRVVLGSDAEQIVRSASVPVLLVRHGGAAPATAG